MANGTKKLNLVVVDGDQLTILAFERLMQSETNYNPDFVDNTRNAIKALELQPEHYDAVLVDVSVSGQSGLTFILSVKNMRPDIPIIFMTGSYSTEMRAAATKYSHIVFLEKPFHLSKVLNETIPKLLRPIII